MAIDTATAALAPTSSTPTLQFSQNANCRAGPSTLYEPVGSFLQSDIVEIIGRNEGDPRWWLVRAPGVVKGKCWVSFVTGTTSGPVESVPVAAAPPLPTKTPKPTPTPVPFFVPSIVPTPTA
jgi:hypothetical protein